MTQNPILKVLSVMHGYRVRFLLIGGQACVLYGGSEFSRDTDLAVLPDRENLERLMKALKQLQAEKIAIPDMSIDALQKGHAVHFRCKHPDVLDMRIDIMSIFRNAPAFETMWDRRTTMDLGDGIEVDVISLPDLIGIKKTQRDKDWFHIRRLIEAHYMENKENRSPDNASFWLTESRTPTMLRYLFKEFSDIATVISQKRTILKLLPECSDDQLSQALADEEKLFRDADRKYWQPLLEELETLRHTRKK
ncbi:MAG: hypothetical protein JW768_01730 [Chitinispirillaceae bacterium]|nr:hypothetical protein [Chitinispirillaceae bacterium]